MNRPRRSVTERMIDVGYALLDHVETQPVPDHLQLELAECADRFTHFRELSTREAELAVSAAERLLSTLRSA